MGHLRPLIVFDLDGTLIDSRRDLASAANALIVERGGTAIPEHAIGEMVGDGAGMLVTRAFAAAKLPLDDGCVPRFLELYDERLLDATRPYDGIPEVLRALAPSHDIAVLTNKPIAPTRTLLAALSLAPLVGLALGGDGPHPRKPDPAGLRSIQSHFDTPAGRVVLVGDSPVDLETARNAGTAACVMRYGFGFRPSILDGLRPNERVLDAASQLPGAIATLLA